jgi:FKBP-type peptidyl-prolyl cis-trans isomerase FkpA
LRLSSTVSGDLVIESFVSRRSLGLKLAAIACLAIAAACGSSSNPMSPSVNVPFSQSDLRVGSGADAVSGRTITVNYTGWLYDESKADQKGAQFDSSVGRGSFSFLLGAGRVIAGWDQGVPGMKVSGVRRLVIPPNLGYGATANGPIPANSTLIFEVELLGVQ